MFGNQGKIEKNCLVEISLVDIACIEKNVVYY